MIKYKGINQPVLVKKTIRKVNVSDKQTDGRSRFITLNLQESGKKKSGIYGNDLLQNEQIYMEKGTKNYACINAPF